MSTVLPAELGTCFIVDDVFSATECRALIERANSIGYQQADPAYPPSYRNNERLVCDDHALAELVLARIRSALPAILIDHDGTRWRLAGVNERFRFCRYRAGQFFKVHRDGVFHRDARTRSKLTFMAYLNDREEFAGGSTRFFPARDSQRLLTRVWPRRGRVIVFDHELWHDAEVLDAGAKYIMRSDIMYERVIDMAERAAAGEPTTTAHAGYIWSLAALPDGLLISGGRDKTIRLWSRRGEALHCQAALHGHQNSVTALLAVGADEIWSGSRDRALRIWRRTAGIFECIKTAGDHAGTVLCLTRLSPTLVASGAADGLVRLWNLGGECVGALQGHRSWVWSIAALDDETFISASEDGSVRLWHRSTGKCLQHLQVEGGPVRCLAVMQQGSIVAVGSADGRIRLLRRATERGLPVVTPSGSLVGHTAEVRALAALGANRLASGAEDDSLRIWNVSRAECEARMSHGDFVTAVLALEDGMLASASYDGSVQLWRQADFRIPAAASEPA